ncbi:MAG: SIMPL domain-containing protein [Dehalococcoidales bacterium]|nr:SIMPL domain-containing protein [Dehalococcoidales bacterium]
MSDIGDVINQMISETKEMKKKWILAVSLALVLVTAVLPGCGSDTYTALEEQTQEIYTASQQSGIWVTGEGKVTAVPDIAILRLGIEAQETSVAVAQTKAADGMDKVMTALTKNEVAMKDIQTQQFSIRRVTKWDREKEEEIIIGFQVTNMVTAKIRDIDKVGSVIDAAAEVGGDLTRIDSISFSVDDPSAYYEEAREKAMADAKAKAEQLAGLAGMTLGTATYISEGIQVPALGYQPGVFMPERAVAAAPTTISPGETEIRLNLQVAYAIIGLSQRK